MTPSHSLDNSIYRYIHSTHTKETRSLDRVPKIHNLSHLRALKAQLQKRYNYSRIGNRHHDSYHWFRKIRVNSQAKSVSLKATQEARTQLKLLMDCLNRNKASKLMMEYYSRLLGQIS